MKYLFKDIQINHITFKKKIYQISYKIEYRSDSYILDDLFCRRFNNMEINRRNILYYRNMDRLQ
jgi:hypothetical protein